MKLQLILGIIGSAILFSCSSKGGSDVKNYAESDSISYVLGHLNASSLLERRDEFPGGGLTVDEYAKGFNDGIDSLDAQLEVANVQMFLNSYFMRAQAKDAEQMTAMENDSTLKLDPYVDIALDSASYIYGMAIGQQFLAAKGTFPGGGMNVAAVKAGFNDAVKGKDSKIAVEDPETYLNNYFQKAQMEEAEAARLKAEAEAGPKLAAIAEFMEENGKKPGVTTHESGKFQYEVIKEGNGKKPDASDNVTVHYHGTFLDGSVFDSSVERGEPATFGLNQVIRGWTEGVVLMPVGSKYKFWIHPDYAYGAQDRGSIPGSSLLIFEVELISIN